MHVTFYKKAAQFAKIQYYRNETKTKKMNETTNEIGANKIASIAPKCSREKLAIAEFLILTSATKEIDGRQYSRKEFWEALAKTTVELKETSGDANLNGNGKERNVGIDKFAADIYNTVSGADDEEGKGRSIVQTDNNHDVELPSGFYGNVENEDGENETNQTREEGQSNDNSADRNEVEIRTASSCFMLSRTRSSFMGYNGIRGNAIVEYVHAGRWNGSYIIRFC